MLRLVKGVHGRNMKEYKFHKLSKRMKTTAEDFSAEFEAHNAFFELKESMAQTVNLSQVHAIELFGLISMLERSEEYQQNHFKSELDSETLEVLQINQKIIQRMKTTAVKIMVQNLNASYCYSENILPELSQNIITKRENSEIIDLKELVFTIVRECQKMLKISKTHELILNIDDTNITDDTALTIKGDTKAITVSIMNLLQNAFLYSPKGSTVVIGIDKSDELANITITNLIGSEPQIIRPHAESENREHYEFGAKLGLVLCEKVALCYDGKFKYEALKDKFTAELSFPLYEGKIPLQFASKLKEYTFDDGNKNNVIWQFMQEILAIA